MNPIPKPAMQQSVSIVKKCMRVLTICSGIQGSYLSTLLVVKLRLKTEGLALKLGELVRLTGLLLALALEVIQTEAMALSVKFDIISLGHFLSLANLNQASTPGATQPADACKVVGPRACADCRVCLRCVPT
jgi:hypothetical protein